MNQIEVRPGLHLIGLEQRMAGMGNFIGAWVHTGNPRFLVDPGPRFSAGKLGEDLRALGVKDLDLIFLTHVHIDHAGGAGTLLRAFPDARVVCHPAGFAHLASPGKLWEGSKKVLGELALLYGEIDPVPEENLVSSDAFRAEGMNVIRTPGHASHHISLVFEDCLFAGEAGGIYQDVGGRVYLRPATPPRFILKETVESIGRLIEAGAPKICYGHFGICGDGPAMLRRFRDQIYFWKETIAEERRRGGGEDDLGERCLAAILTKDPLLAELPRMGEDERRRELYFLPNSIRGYLEYLSALDKKN
jgi:glyoxylase-like metal-dependent hydrolase (beta-lactamase superfamily II)